LSISTIGQAKKKAGKRNRRPKESDYRGENLTLSREKCAGKERKRVKQVVVTK